MSIERRMLRVLLAVAVFACVSAPLFAVEKGSEQVSPFMGSFSYGLPIDAPAYHGIGPRLGLSYTSEGRNGFAGVGWNVAGFGTVERTNAGGGTPRFDTNDIYVLGGAKLLPCTAGLNTPSCTTGGTHTAETENFARISFDAGANTWTLWDKGGTRTVFTPLLTAAGGTYKWGQSSVIDTLGNTVTYAWSCTTDCYPSSVSYGPYQVSFFRETRPDVISFARGADLGRMSQRLRSVIVFMPGVAYIRGYKLDYTVSALTGRSLLSSVRQYGRDLVHDGAGLFTAGSTLPPQTFTYTEDTQGRSFISASAAPPTPPSTTENVSWAERKNATPINDGSSLQKTDGVNYTWDAFASSTRALASGDGYVEVTAGADPGKRFGLGRKTKDFTPDEIDFSFWETNDGSGHVVYAYQKATALGSWPAPAGVPLRIEISSGSVLFKINGVVVHTLTGSRITYPLVAAASLSYNNAVIQSARLSGALQDSSSWCWGAQLLTGDFDGDGRTDQACHTNYTTGSGTSDPRLRVKLSTGSGFADPVVWSSGTDFSRAVGGDYNNDGKTDLAIFSQYNSDVFVSLSNGTALEAPVLWGHAAAEDANGFPHNCSTPYTALGAGDFNGDGQLDVSCRQAWRGDLGAPSPILIGLSTDTGFTFSVWGDLGCDAPAYQRTSAIDFDGDGKDDWVCQSGGGNLQVYVSTGSEFIYPSFGSLTSNFCASRYVLGDLNGDGRTDAACADNGKVALSTGRNFVEQGTYGAWCAIVPTEDPISTQVFAADVDGDGASEIVCNNSQAGTNDITVRKWSDAGLGAAETWKSSWCEGLLRGGDFNGDGKSDLLCDNLGTPVAFTGTAGTRVDLLAHVMNSLGGTLDATYAPLTTFPNTNNPGTRPVVTSLRRDDGRGGVSISTYSYSGGKIDRKLRKFLGFRYVRETKPCITDETVCPYNETWLRQDPYVPGLPERVDARTGAGQLLASQQYEYAPSPTTPPYMSMLTGEWAYAYDSANPNISKRSYATHAYDAYGNETQRVDHGDYDATGDESTTARAYVPNTSAYIVGLPSTETRYAGVGTSGTQLTRMQFAYDGAAVGAAPAAGLPTRQEQWLDTTGTYVASTRGYDTWGNPTTTTDPSNATTTTTFDTAHHLFPVQVTNPVNESVSSAWDIGCGVPTSSTDANNQTTSQTLDAFCRVTRKDGPLGSFEIRSYVDLGTPTLQRMVTEGPAASGTTNQWASESLDGFGRMYRTTSQGPNAGQDILVDRTYTARGALASQTRPYYTTDPAPTPTRYEHDALDRVTKVVLPDAEQVTTTYGAWKQTVTDPLGRATTVTYDAFGRQLTGEQDDGQGRTLVTQRGYDPRGALATFRDPAGNLWTWQHDSLGRLTSSVDPDSGAWTYVYDILGRKTTQTDAKGQAVEQWLDAAGHVTQKRTTDTASQTETVTFSYGGPSFGYFNAGRLTGMTDVHGSAHYDYDALGRQVRVRRTLDGAEYTLQRRYDAAGRLVGITFPDGDTFGTSATPLQYDVAGRLIAAPGLVSSASYDAAGRRLTATFANGAETKWSYHERGWVTEINTTVGTTTVQDLAYAVNAAGQTTQVTSPNTAQTWAYTYDALGHLITATNASPSLSQSFQYDAAGNMTYNSRVGTLSYPLPGSARPHAPTDVSGQAMTYDANGNMLTGRGRTITWNALNLPIQINGTQYVYDGSGVRLKKVAAGNATLYPIGDDYEVTNGVVTKYAKLPGLGLVAKRVGTTTYWLHTDRLGSVQAITDAAGAVVQERTYRPYGETIADSTTHEETRGYIGERQDADTGLSYLHARYYDAELGLFLSADPTSPTVAGVGFSRYAYALGAPIDGIDPTGLTREDSNNHETCERFPWICTSGAVGGGIGGLGGPGPGSSPSHMSDLPPVLTGPMGYIHPSNNAARSAAEARGVYFYDTATGAIAYSPVGLTFRVPTFPGGPTILGEFFIQTPAALGLKGDNRGFDPAANPTQSRAFFSLDFTTGFGFVQVNPSCNTSGRCESALAFGQGNSIGISYPGPQSISIRGSLVNSIIPWGASINFEIAFTATSRGVFFVGTRDAFPSLEITGSRGGFFAFPETTPFALMGPPFFPHQGISGFVPGVPRW